MVITLSMVFLTIRVLLGVFFMTVLVMIICGYTGEYIYKYIDKRLPLRGNPERNWAWPVKNKWIFEIGGFLFAVGLWVVANILWVWFIVS